MKLHALKTNQILHLLESLFFGGIILFAVFLIIASMVVDSQQAPAKYDKAKTGNYAGPDVIVLPAASEMDPVAITWKSKNTLIHSSIEKMEEAVRYSKETDLVWSPEFEEKFMEYAKPVREEPLRLEVWMVSGIQ